MSDYVKLTQLTPEEQAFAEENYSTLKWCISKQKLDEDLYDVAAFGYLQAVKKWFARPEIRKWSFKTIANQAVRGSIGNERKKQERRIKTVSLDAVIPGTDGVTYGETVTEENMRLLTEGVGKEVYAKTTYDADIPVATRMSRKASAELLELIEFLNSNHYAMCFEFIEEKEAKRKTNSFRSWRRFHKRYDFKIRKKGKMIFIEKLDAKPKKGE